LISTRTYENIGTADFAGIAARIKAKSPDAVIMPSGSTTISGVHITWLFNGTTLTVTVDSGWLTSKLAWVQIEGMVHG